MFAVTDGETAAGLIAAQFGEEAIYLYGASSTRHRAHGAAFLLQHEAMRWAREAGCTRYDLWGIPPVDQGSSEAADGKNLAGTRGDDWRGLYEFKVRFGGEVRSYPPTLERRYRPLLAAVARTVYADRG
jgi:lipid II:glycine glycyltransferase (peptidoglycan interpeptide bridge formation enzyme)